ncbi:hypothetical protein [Vibrio phage vB_pir03]|nr:hypothetical protein [Vibrio phage vB_pir03]
MVVRHEGVLRVYSSLLLGLIVIPFLPPVFNDSAAKSNRDKEKPHD